VWQKRQEKGSVGFERKMEFFSRRNLGKEKKILGKKQKLSGTI